LELKFRRSNQEELVHSLGRVVKGEKLVLDKGVLELIAQRADGSFRDGQKILDQLSSVGEKISLIETQKLLGQIEELKPEKLLNFLASQDLKASLLEIDRIVNFGADLEIYLQNLLEKLRLMLLKIIGVEINNGQEINLIEGLGKADITSLINAFTKAASEMKVTPIQQLPLELVAVEWCHSEAPSGDKKEEKTLSKEEEPVSSKKEAVKIETTVQDQENGIKPILEKWGDLLLGVRPLNHSVEALLRAARPLKMDNGFLTLEVFYKFHKERLDSEKCRAIVEEVASQLLGNPVKLKCVLGEKNHSTEEKNNDIMEIASEIFNGKLVD
jgi:DNA polymerase-3 subunit gamma/tau